MSLAGYLGIGFMCIAYAGLMWCLCITASKADDIMEQEAREYWRTTIYLKGSDCDD